MKPTLQFRLSQHLTLTPQLQQSIRLLQLSTVELNQEIERMLQDNPILEREDGDGDVSSDPDAGFRAGEPGEQSSQDAASEPSGEVAGDMRDEWQSETAASWRGSDDDDDGDRSPAAPDTPTLRDHLLEQLSLTTLGERDRTLVAILIDVLDEDGYLTQSLEEIAALFPADAEVGMDEITVAMRHLQSMEPAGIGARSPAECLAVQIRRLDGPDTLRTLALTVVEQHLELLAARDYARLRLLTGVGDDDLREAQRLIQSLNPRPGAAFAKSETRYVVPDVIVRKVKGVWRASLNAEAMPKLRINQLCADFAGSRNGANSLASQLQEARWMIRNVQQRFDTILRVSQAIVDRQRHFFEAGEVAMRPMVLREIAETLSLHESAISRVTTQKYMSTPRGTFELKYFFGSHVATDAGGAASSTAIRALIKQLVAAENPRTPLSDASISKILGEQGIVVARRTIAKYREAMQIPAVSQRKAL